MNGEAYTILNVRSFVGTFSDLRLMKHWKSVSLTDSDVQTFLEGEEKEKSENAYSVALVMTFLAAENKSRPLEHFSQANFGHEPERFLLSVRSKSITKNFVHWKLRPLFVFVYSISRHQDFPSWASLSSTHCAIFIQRLSILLLSVIS